VGGVGGGGGEGVGWRGGVELLYTNRRRSSIITFLVWISSESHFFISSSNICRQNRIFSPANSVIHKSQ